MHEEFVMTFTKKDFEAQQKKFLELEEELELLDRAFHATLEKLGLTEEDIKVDISELSPEVLKELEEQQKAVKEQKAALEQVSEENKTTRKSVGTRRKGAVKL